MVAITLRAAEPDDAEHIALLHADNWRRRYRGVFADAYLDGDVVAERRSVWTARLAAPGDSLTLLAEDDDGLVGFGHVVFDEDDRWGSLLDNLHVVHSRQGSGLGRVLLTRVAEAAAERATSRSLYLWVLEANTAARGFYRTLGGATGERATVPPPGGEPDRLTGSPAMFRITWPDVTSLGGLTTR
ncbi:GNAT family N-acetyltransferase [Streptomyces sp. B6B3]|uniref:GNAT family N-acetyltransferase n=1 Tax=Streptomyces sp. B6B3 TaxID=3153570 RepID=UPI00325DE0FF